MNESRITRRADTMSGAYCIRGTRIPVWIVQRYVAANGAEWTLRDYPTLTREDIAAALAFRRDQYRGADVD